MNLNPGLWHFQAQSFYALHWASTQADNRTQHQHTYLDSGHMVGRWVIVFLIVFPIAFIFPITLLPGASFVSLGTNHKDRKKGNNEQNFPDLGPDIYHHLAVGC